MAQRAERVPVSWSVSNRPQNSNLVFEQILSDGRLVNVELPRQNPIVPSSGSGVVAPLLPGGNATQIQLVLRLIDLGTGSEYARRTITVPIVSTIPNEDLIASFNSTATSVNIGSLLGGTARVPVSWSLRARPANTNLVFEQRLLNGQTVNVELPRQNPIVPSSGSGTTAPVWPGDQAQEIVLLLRLVNLSSGATLDSTEIYLPIVGNTGGGIDYGATCLQAPYAPTQGLAVGVTAQVVSGDTANGLRALNLPQGDVVETLPIGETFTVIGGPACWTIQTLLPAQTDFRVWRIRTFRNNLEAWLPEYQYIVDGARYVYYIQLVQTDGGGQDQDPVINSFAADRSSVAPGGTVVLNWNSAHASSVSIQVLDPAGQAVQNFDNLPLQSSLTFTLPQDYSGSVGFMLALRDAQGSQLLSQELSVTISCAFANAMDPSRCPVSQATVQMAYQTYQNGIMLWRGDGKIIYVLYNDGSFQTFDDTWTPDQPADTGETPPDGLILPAHGFGKVWANQPGVRDHIGWATTPESGFGGSIESYTGPTETYISMPDGRTLVIGQGWRTQ